MIKCEGVPEPARGATATTQVAFFEPKVEIRRTLQEFQRLVDEPSEAELLAKNLQAVNSQLVSDLADFCKVVEELIFKREELTNHYEMLLQDKQVAYEALEHQLGRAKARVYNLDTDLKALRYEVRKLEDELEVVQ